MTSQILYISKEYKLVFLFPLFDLVDKSNFATGHV